MSDYYVARPGAQAADSGLGFGLDTAARWLIVIVASVVVMVGAYFVGYVAGNGAGEADPAGGAGPQAATTTPAEETRVLLTVEIDGAGSGRVHIDPLGISCTETCERELDAGTHVTLKADAVRGSHFEGWDDTCSGASECSFDIDRERQVSATFEGTPAPSECEDGRDNDGDGLRDAADPGCRRDSTEAPDNSPKPGQDCHDGIDNDSDGLVDSAQDPGCERDGTEADGSAAPVAPPPAAPPPPPECSDGIDNDADGLVDSAQDPDCASGGSEGAGAAPPTSECHDGIDNDGDGHTDRPADPGCDADGTEAGG